MRLITLLAAIAALATTAFGEVQTMTYKVTATKQGSHDLVQGVGSAFIPWSTQPNGAGSYCKTWLCRVWYSGSANLGSETVTLDEKPLAFDVSDEIGETLGTAVSAYCKGHINPLRNCWDAHPEATYMRYWYGGELLLWDWTTGIPARLCGGTPVKTVYR